MPYSKVNYGDLKKHQRVVVADRIEEINGQKLPLPINKVCAFMDSDYASSGNPSDGKLHYLYDHELDEPVEVKS